MHKEFRKRAGKFISEYLDLKSGTSYEDESVIRQGVAMLINSDIFCEKELQKEAITKHGILITSTLISECLEE